MTALQLGGPLLRAALQKKIDVPDYVGPSAKEQGYEKRLDSFTREGAFSEPIISRTTRQIGGTTQQGLSVVNEFEDPVQRMNAVLKVMEDSSREGSDAVLRAESMEDQMQTNILGGLMDRGQHERQMRMNYALTKAGLVNQDRGIWGDALYEGTGNISQNLMMQQYLKMLLAGGVKQPLPAANVTADNYPGYSFG